jgi:sulfhydrogenase subunit beta (sulfur reductase)
MVEIATAKRRMVLAKERLSDLVKIFQGQGFTVIAPVLQNGVILLRPISNADQIARGLHDVQDGGHYRLEKNDTDFYFEYVVGPDSAKRYFFPPEQNLFGLKLEEEGFRIEQIPTLAPKLAFLGLRSCGLAAVHIQDRVFATEPDQQKIRCEADSYYNQARQQSFLVAIDCTRPGGTCFCGSMGTGPEATNYFDVAMTELRAGFVIRAGSEKGASLLSLLPLRDPSSAELELVDLKLQLAREHMGRLLETEGLVELLDRNVEDLRWSEVAERCLSCGNCTMVCPTCFCSTVSDASDLTMRKVTRTRQWESCFTHQFSYTTMGPHRHTIRGRYRHWLRHKLGTWWEQFGTSGCVGCGRCITWCPVGIDLTEEVAAIHRGHSRGTSPAAVISAGSKMGRCLP